MLAVEFHGYHSKRWKPIPVTLPSQWYGFSLVERAIERAAVIVILRGHADWEIAVPGLAGYENLVVTRNPQASAISSRNCGEESFEKIVRAVGQPTGEV